jgi:hypothetical protein
MFRKNVMLSINIDKSTEKDLQLAVEKGLAMLQEHDSSIELVDFTSYANLARTPGHYVIFLELNHTLNGSEHTPSDSDSDLDIAQHHVEEDPILSGLQGCANAIDLAFQDPGYIGSRKSRSIGPLELCILHPGTFHYLLERYLVHGIAITQYKTPRCVSSQELRDILHSNVCTYTFSTAYR